MRPTGRLTFLEMVAITPEGDRLRINELAVSAMYTTPLFGSSVTPSGPLNEMRLATVPSDMPVAPLPATVTTVPSGRTSRTR